MDFFTFWLISSILTTVAASIATYLDFKAGATEKLTIATAFLLLVLSTTPIIQQLLFIFTVFYLLYPYTGKLTNLLNHSIFRKK